MLIAYLNYPNSVISIHADKRCGHVRSQAKEGQRTVAMSLSSLSRELEKFAVKEHQFSSTAALNDMWLEVDCADLKFEREIVKFIIRTLAQRYKPFRNAKIHSCNCV